MTNYLSDKSLRDKSLSDKSAYYDNMEDDADFPLEVTLSFFDNRLEGNEDQVTRPIVI